MAARCSKRNNTQQVWRAAVPTRGSGPAPSLKPKEVAGPFPQCHPVGSLTPPAKLAELGSSVSVKVET